MNEDPLPVLTSLYFLLFSCQYLSGLVLIVGSFTYICSNHQSQKNLYGPMGCHPLAASWLGAQSLSVLQDPLLVLLAGNSLRFLPSCSKIWCSWTDRGTSSSLGGSCSSSERCLLLTPVERTHSCCQEPIISTSKICPGTDPLGTQQRQETHSCPGGKHTTFFLQACHLDSFFKVWPTISQWPKVPQQLRIITVARTPELAS